MTNKIIISGSELKLESYDLHIDYHPEFLNYTCSAPDQLPIFNAEFTSDLYEVNQIDNGDGTWTTSLTVNYYELLEKGYPNSISFKNNQNLIAINNINCEEYLTDMTDLFNNCQSLKVLNLENLKTNNVISAQCAFCKCYEITSLNLSHLDFSKCENMNGMFNACSKLTSLDISNWNTESLTDISLMFYSTPALQELKGIETLNVNNVIRMNEAFTTCGVPELDLSNWNVSNVTSFHSMFYNSTIKTLNLSGWIFGPESILDGMFFSCQLLKDLDVSNWNTTNVISMAGMFKQCYALRELDLSHFNTSNVTNMAAMFHSSINFVTINVSNWDTSKVTIMDGIFYDCNNLESIIGIEDFDISKVTQLNRFFQSCYKLKSLDLSKWCAPEAQRVYFMFWQCWELTELDLSSFNASKLWDAEGMFYDCRSLTSLNVSNWNTVNLKESVNMFGLCRSLPSLDLSSWTTTSNLTNIGKMFQNCNALKTLNVSSFDTSKVTDMSYAFHACYELTSLDLTGWDTSSVIGMNTMFRDCGKLEKIIGIEDFNTSNVENLSYTFHGCNALKELKLNKWNTSNVTNMSSLFFGCNVCNIEISDWDTSNVTSLYCTFRDSGNATYDVSRWDVSKVNNFVFCFYSYCYRPVIDISGWEFDSATDVGSFAQHNRGAEILNIRNTKFHQLINGLSSFMANIPKLKYVICDYTETIELIYDQFLDRTNSDAGVLYCENKDQLSSTVVNALKAKNWEVKSSEDVAIATYTFDSNICADLIPRFNEDFDSSYLVKTDKVDENGIVTRTLESYVNEPTSISFYDPEGSIMEQSLLSVDDLNISELTSARDMFKGCSNLTRVRITGDSKNITSTASMFEGCSKLEKLEIPQFIFDINTWAEFADMFKGCDSLKELWLNDSGTIELFNMIIFNEATAPTSRFFAGEKTLYTTANLSDELLQSLSDKGWNRRNVVAQYLFNSAVHENCLPVFNEGFEYEIIDYADKNRRVLRTIISDDCPTQMKFGISTKNGAAAEEIARVDSLLQVYSINAKELTTMARMFQSCEELINVNCYDWNTSNVTDMSYVFSNCYKLKNINVSKWDISKVTDIKYSFFYCKDLIEELDLSQWNTSNVRSARYAFSNVHVPLNVSNWTIKDCDCFLMFGEYSAGLGYNGTTITGLDTWNLSGTCDLRGMFMWCQHLNHSLNLNNWDVSQVTSMKEIFASCYKVPEIKIDKWVTSNVVDMTSMFAKCFKLTSLDLSKWDTNKVTNMVSMFINCNELTTIGDLSNWDTSSVTNMQSMFQYCYKLQLIGIENWNTSSMTDIDYMFNCCYELTSLDLSKWDVSKLKNGAGMLFRDCDKLSSLNISTWKMSNELSSQFGCFIANTKLKELDLSSWTFDPLGGNIVFNYTFDNMPKLTRLILPKWNNAKVTGAENMFKNVPNLKFIDLTDFNIQTENYTTMFDLSPNIQYIKCNLVDTITKLAPIVPDRTGLNEQGFFITELELSDELKAQLTARNWTTKSIESCVKIAEYIFDSSVHPSCVPYFNEDFNFFLVDEIVNDSVLSEIVNEETGTIEEGYKQVVKRIIYSINNNLPTSITFGHGHGEKYKIQSDSLLEVNYLNVSNATRLYALFGNCRKLRYVNTDEWDTSKVTNMYSIFNNCISLKSLNVNHFDVSNVTENSYMFLGASEIESLDLSNWRMSKIKNFGHFFQGCTSLISIDLTGFITPSITAMHSLFAGCENLIEIKGIEDWNVSNVTSTDNMFNGCKLLTELDLNNWDTSKLEDIDYMFSECQALTKLNISNWNTSSLASLQCTFLNCKSLKLLDLNNWNTSNVWNLCGTFEYCEALTSLNISDWDVTSVVNSMGTFNNCHSLVDLDLSKWNFNGNRISSFAMICKCRNLKKVDLGNNYWRPQSIHNCFYDCPELETVDISNLTLKEVINAFNYFFANVPKLTNIGLIHADEYTINTVASRLGTSVSRTIWVGNHINIDSLNVYENITYKKQESDKVRLVLDSPLLEGDEIKVIDGQLCHVHNKGIIILDGTEDWGRAYGGDYDTTNTILFATKTDILMRQDGLNVCNNFKTGRIYDLIFQRPDDIEGVCVLYYDYNPPYSYIDVRINKNRLSELSGAGMKQWVSENPIVLAYELLNPYTTIIRSAEGIDLSLYENGSIYFSDPTVTVNQIEDENNLIIESIVGDSVVNVSKQKEQIELTLKDDSTPSSLKTSDGKLLKDLMSSNFDTTKPSVNSENALDYFDCLAFTKLQANKTYTMAILNNPCCTEAYGVGMFGTWRPLQIGTTVLSFTTIAEFISEVKRNFMLKKSRIMTDEELSNLKFLIFEGDYVEELTNNPELLDQYKEERKINPRIEGQTLVNAMHQLIWEDMISTEERIGFKCTNISLSNKKITVSNLTSRPIMLAFNNVGADYVEIETREIAVGSTEIIEITSDLYLAQVYGLIENGWTEENKYELKLINIFEDEVIDIPDGTIIGLRNTFDESYIKEENSYKISFANYNAPVRFGKGGRK